MSGMMDKFRNFSKALSNEEESKEEAGHLKSGAFSLLSKFGVSNSKEKEPDRRHKTLLVVDSHDNNWVKLLKGRTLHCNLYDIRVEQATFAELSIVSSCEKGVTVSMRVLRNGGLVSRSFRPDFVLVRERFRGVEPKADAKTFLFGLMHGNVPSLNSLETTLSFMEKPLMYSQLLKIQKRLGKDEFPLIEQTYYQSFNEMMLPPSLPVVVKVGSANSGYGKVCVASPRGFQDVASLVAVADTFATTEPFLDGKYDIRIQKIGRHYKVYKRRSLSDSWKANTGTSVVEEIALTDRYKQWADECSKLFDGIDILCVEAIHTKCNTEKIIEITDTGMTGSSEQIKEDMRLIGDLAIKKMETIYHPHFEREASTATTAVLSGAMNIVGGAASPQKVNPSRPSTADPTLRESGPANGGPMRKATSQEVINVRGSESEKAGTTKVAGSNPTTPRAGRRSSLAGRFLSAITD